VRLVYERSGAGELGRVKGRIALDGETFRVDAGAFVETLERGSLRRPVDRILACFGRHLALKAEMAWDSQEVRAARLTPDGAEDVGPARLVQGARGALRLELAGAPPLRCRSSTKVTLLRPAGGHGHRRVTLSTAHFRWGAATPGAGFLERSRPAEIL
jgi:hypothetical protein